MFQVYPLVSSAAAASPQTHWIFLPVGLLLLGVVMVDVARAVLLQGGGPITHHMSLRLWGTAVHVCRSRGWHRLLTTSGVVLLAGTILTWIVGLWLGWTAVLSSVPQAVLDKAGGPSTLLERFEYAGNALVTLSLHPAEPGTPLWSVVTSLISLSGFALISLSMAYLLPVVSAVATKRSLAQRIVALAPAPDVLVARVLHPRTREPTAQRVSELLSDIAILGEQYIAYPVLHLFHSTSARHAPTLQIAKLDEALTLFELYADDDSLPPPVDVHALRCAIDNFIGAQNPGNGDEPPPPLDFTDVLASVGLQRRDAATVEEHYARWSKRRRVLMHAVLEEGWTWDDVTKQTEPDQEWKVPYAESLVAPPGQARALTVAHRR